MKHPSTVDEILATADMDRSFAKVWTERGCPPAFPDADILRTKRVWEKMLPDVQEKLRLTRPADIEEMNINVELGNGISSRFIICKPAARTSPSPVIVLFHGGAYCLAWPEAEVELARELVRAHKAIVVCPSYRLGPEHVFPAPMEDGWAALKYIAAELRSPHTTFTPLFPPSASPTSGFIVGGTSAGGHLACVVTHLAQANDLSPPVTGQFLSCGFMASPDRVPLKYRHLFLSWEQNREAPLYSRALVEEVRGLMAPEEDSPLWTVLDQKHPEDAPGEVKMGHMGQPPTYFQACGLDANRDESLIYERVLRKECGIPTRIDVYKGLPHCFWVGYRGLEKSKQRMRDSIEGIRWLLHQGTGPKAST